MSQHTQQLLTFTLILWLGLGVGAYLKVPTIIQNALEVKTDG